MKLLQNLLANCLVLLHGCVIGGVTAVQGRKHFHDQSHSASSITYIAHNPSTTPPLPPISSHNASFITHFVQQPPITPRLFSRVRPWRAAACAAVFDGHGSRGSEIAQLAKQTLENTLRKLFKYGARDLTSVVQKAMREVARVVDGSDLAMHGGAAGSVVLIRGRMVVMGHVGDASVTLWGKRKASEVHQPCLVYKSRSHDLKSVEEALRVLRAGGRIEVPYVVNKKDDTGLAITRSFGDLQFRKYGCMSEVEVVERRMRKGDSVVIATDGYWNDVDVSMEKVHECIRDLSQNPKELADKLMRQTEYRGYPWDDATVICLTRQ